MKATYIKPSIFLNSSLISYLLPPPFGPPKRTRVDDRCTGRVGLRRQDSFLGPNGTGAVAQLREADDLPEVFREKTSRSGGFPRGTARDGTVGGDRHGTRWSGSVGFALGSGDVGVGETFLVRGAVGWGGWFGAVGWGGFSEWFLGGCGVENFWGSDRHMGTVS